MQIESAKYLDIVMPMSSNYYLHNWVEKKRPLRVRFFLPRPQISTEFDKTFTPDLQIIVIYSNGIFLVKNLKSLLMPSWQS